MKPRLAIVEWAMEHGIKPAGERFGLDRKTVREWRDRYRARGILGLVPAYPERRTSRVPAEVIALIEQARRELQYGAARTRIWLRRVHKRHVPMATISRTFGTPVSAADIKLTGRKGFQYTAIDDCTCTAPGFVDSVRGYHGMGWTTIVDPDATARSEFSTPVLRQNVAGANWLIRQA